MPSHTHRLTVHAERPQPQLRRFVNKEHTAALITASFGIQRGANAAAQAQTLGPTNPPQKSRTEWEAGGEV